MAQKVHGGIAALDGTPRPRAVSLPFIENRDIAVEAKTAIAHEAASWCATAA
ncbi:hypothetical protein ACFQFQ_21015 [Sulfitobacter porphyrae]|uniref:Uncharacterized protein n=1 Tax=Sulfitobacter porphyrae TaxID=1246864 RepID=A0ABW2B830_9RHOB